MPPKGSPGEKVVTTNVSYVCRTYANAHAKHHVSATHRADTRRLLLPCCCAIAQAGDPPPPREPSVARRNTRFAEEGCRTTSMIQLSVNVLAHPPSPCAHASAMPPRFRSLQSCWFDCEKRYLRNAPRVTVCSYDFRKLDFIPSLDRHFPRSPAAGRTRKKSPFRKC